MNDLNIYGCGGCGLNQVRNVMGYLEEKQADFKHIAKINPYIIDGSKSDLGDGVSESDPNVFLIPDMDGNGKQRLSENNTKIKDSIPKILNDFPPSRYNIIIHSAGGGSGSVIGPMLRNAMMGNPDLIVIVIVVGSSESQIEIKNTLATLKGYQANSAKKDAPTIMRYFENNSSTGQNTVDQDIIGTIIMLGHAFNNSAGSLDFKDIYNFINYSQKGVTEFKAGLVGLEIITGPITLERDKSAISVVSFQNRDTPSDLGFTPPYHASGFYNPNVIKDLGEDMFPLRFVTVSNFFNNIHLRFEEMYRKSKETTELATKSQSAMANADEADDDGMIF